MKTWQTFVRDAAIRTLNEGAKRIGDGERIVHRLAQEWRELDDQGKQEIAEIVVAVGGAIGVAVAAYREGGPKKKSKAKKLVKKTGKKVLKKVVANVAEMPVKRGKKK